MIWYSFFAFQIKRCCSGMRHVCSHEDMFLNDVAKGLRHAVPEKRRLFEVPFYIIVDSNDSFVAAMAIVSFRDY